MDKTGQTMDFLLTEHRDEAAVLRFLKTLLLDSGVFYSNSVREAQPIFKAMEK